MPAPSVAMKPISQGLDPICRIGSGPRTWASRPNSEPENWQIRDRFRVNARLMKLWAGHGRQTSLELPLSSPLTMATGLLGRRQLPLHRGNLGMASDLLGPLTHRARRTTKQSVETGTCSDSCHRVSKWHRSGEDRGPGLDATRDMGTPPALRITRRGPLKTAPRPGVRGIGFAVDSVGYRPCDRAASIFASRVRVLPPPRVVGL